MCWFGFLSCVFIQVGSLASSGNGTPCTAPAGASKRALKKARSANNAAVLARLREDENSAELKELGEKDANHSRMSKWKIASLLELRACSVSSRFGVEQGPPPLHLFHMSVYYPSCTGQV